MARYVFKDGHFRDPKTGKPMEVPERDYLATPQIIPDIQPYRSPIDGAYIGSRNARRYDLEKHDCVPAQECERRTSSDGKFRNKRFAAKHNLPLSEEALDNG